MQVLNLARGELEDLKIALQDARQFEISRQRQGINKTLYGKKEIGRLIKVFDVLEDRIDYLIKRESVMTAVRCNKVRRRTTRDSSN